ncbi:MAG: DUF5043 domain-containing protein [Bacteroidaceae bacterium]|nr:DUF5043 domain-containing protein [Bacteroidaceae bacterium]MBR5612327.1 DUF5043 domain-containing protein [Bacteroidaceae bacterium]
MKKLLFTLVAIFNSLFLFSQTNYYSETKTFTESDYTYKTEVYSWGIIKLYNTSNSWINKSMMYKGTDQIYIKSDLGEDLFDHASWLVGEENIQTIVSSAFSRDEKRMIGDKEMIITMYVNSTTGRIDDVMFKFFDDSPYRFVPVSTYRKIELDIKQNVQMTLTEAGRNLNYIYWWKDIVPGL